MNLLLDFGVAGNKILTMTDTVGVNKVLTPTGVNSFVCVLHVAQTNGKVCVTETEVLHVSDSVLLHIFFMCENTEFSSMGHTAQHELELYVHLTCFLAAAYL